MCAERSLVTIFGLNEYLMITGAQIGLREKLRTRQLVKQLINQLRTPFFLGPLPLGLTPLRQQHQQAAYLTMPIVVEFILKMYYKRNPSPRL